MGSDSPPLPRIFPQIWPAFSRRLQWISGRPGNLHCLQVNQPPNPQVIFPTPQMAIPTPQVPVLTAQETLNLSTWIFALPPQPMTPQQLTASPPNLFSPALAFRQEPAF